MHFCKAIRYKKKITGVLFRPRAVHKLTIRKCSGNKIFAFARLSLSYFYLCFLYAKCRTAANAQCRFIIVKERILLHCSYMADTLPYIPCVNIRCFCTVYTSGTTKFKGIYRTQAFYCRKHV